MVSIGTCNLHVTDDAFSRTVTGHSSSVQELAINPHFIFKLSAARKEDLTKTQLDHEIIEGVFARCVSMRRVSLGDVVERLTEEWDTICQSFKEREKLDWRKQLTSASFGRIVIKLKETVTADAVLTKCGTCHQAPPALSAQPEIHIMHEEINA